MQPQTTQTAKVVGSWEEFSAATGGGPPGSPEPVPAVGQVAMPAVEQVPAPEHREVKLDTAERRKIIDTALKANRGAIPDVPASSGPAARDMDLTAFLRREGVSQAAIDHAFKVHSDRLALQDKVAAKLGELGLKPGTSAEKAGEHLRSKHPELDVRYFHCEQQLEQAVDRLLRRLPGLIDRKVEDLEDILARGAVPHIWTGITFKISKFKYDEWQRNAVLVGAKLATFPVYALTRLAVSNRPPNLGTPKLESIKSPAFDRLRAEVDRMGLTLKVHSDENWKFANVWISFENLIPAH